jgi:SET family sugar efflux transporter-like MFS transporter
VLRFGQAGTGSSSLPGRAASARTSAALLWGLQFAFLDPALALLLVSLFDGGASEVGRVLAIHHAGGFVASLVIPAYGAGLEIPALLLCGRLAGGSPRWC